MRSSQRWRCVPSPAGDGEVFVCADESEVTAVIPPGRKLPGHQTAPAAVGWRLARWTASGEDPPAMDIDRPVAVVSLETVDVIGLLPADMREVILDIMLAQRSLADAFYVPADDAPLNEAAAEAQSRAIAWVRVQLVPCFSDGDSTDELLACLLPIGAVSAEPQAVPATADELLRRIPAAPPAVRRTATWTATEPSSLKLKVLIKLVSVLTKRKLQEIRPGAGTDFEMGAGDSLLLLMR